MQEAIIQGILMGLLLSVLIGPAFFVLIETSIVKGVKFGLAFDLGVLLADVIFIFIALSFTGEITEMALQKSLVERIGGGVFIAFGITGILKKSSVLPDSKSPEINYGTEYLKVFLKGFLLNVLNPGVLVFWVAVVVWASGECAFTGNTMTAFFASTLGVFFCIDLFKIFGARQLRKVLSAIVLKRINTITGIILITFGVVMIAHSF